MDRAELASAIDHTVLGPETTREDVTRVVDEAVEYGMNVCIPPCYVAEAREYAPEDLTVATVVGFPHGQNTPTTKRTEATTAWENGADELDVVINVGRLQAGDTDAVRSEIAAVVEAVPIPIKVIIEAPLLTDASKDTACELAADAGADFVKTATGFADGGATVADVERMAEYLPVKASGGIGDWSTARAMLEGGAERLGASSGVEIVEDFERTRN
ncbi:deoxyribose-phosphate aldolase [Halanaeroarchaeum sulfurireducens]|uniref:Deoxyribose-phosphate aldolase n=1 Tax=Halanaeroarchaeum sulfurireducens TaxID=1604004 RepID=A0A0F7PGF8_9EURY|nr:deoxyribose-phosphate aldolase [Halanaeroarchaeum sulfurireducens]AKH98388.1 deoxyribose-phosphate aldolase [Halanaeroarchaeum sulfurireducens]ALG82782.1 deoxyribose-phosphate aldolase [Halanaeroarchaeum sulfurireducens]